MNFWIHKFLFTSSMLDIWPAHCVFLEDLNPFMNYWPPLISIASMSFRLRIFYIAGYKRFFWTVIGASLIYTEFDCRRTTHRRVVIYVFYCPQDEWHGLPIEACGDECAPWWRLHWPFLRTTIDNPLVRHCCPHDEWKVTPPFLRMRENFRFDRPSQFPAVTPRV